MFETVVNAVLVDPTNSPANVPLSRAAPRAWARPSCGASLPAVRRWRPPHARRCRKVWRWNCLSRPTSAHARAWTRWSGKYWTVSAAWTSSSTMSAAPPHRAAACWLSATRIGRTPSTPTCFAAVRLDRGTAARNAEAGIGRHHPYLVHPAALAVVRGDARLCGRQGRVDDLQQGAVEGSRAEGRPREYGRAGIHRNDGGTSSRRPARGKGRD